MARDTTQLQTIIAPSIEALGFEFVGCLYVPQGRYAVLRIYIDNQDGITVDDCEQVSRQVSAVLDVEDPIKGAYTLEVSSPGLDRPLFTREHYKRFIGKKAHIRLHVPLENRRNFTGIIQEVVDDNVIIQAEDEKFTLALNNIARANLEPEVNFKKK
jgi:ribosome maturation factor RimP